jgi:tetratricopeptide (TPR) repeat protein
MPLTIAVAGLIAYGNSFSAPLHFDDIEAIELNPTIRSVSDIGAVLRPPRDTSVAGRPTANFSLAVNYALSGLNPGSYHVVNLLIHVAAGLTLFGIVRRTLGTAPLAARYGAAAAWAAWAVAILWVVHPLQTMCVTYIVQRTEALMALCYLLTLYCVIRGSGAPRPGGWYLLAVGCCGLGMGAKESMVTAPVAVLLYDRAFLGGSFAGGFRRRGPLYLGLAATWIILLLLVASTPRSASAGYSQNEVRPLAYLITQPEVVLHYIGLALRPWPLCIDYDWPSATSMAQVIQPALVIAVLLALSLWALWRNRPEGLAGTTFFLILAPTSSIVPIIIVASEHRMYLPLALVIAISVVVAISLLLPAQVGIPPRRTSAFAARSIIAIVLALGAATGLALLTIERNRVYQSTLSLWTDTVRLRPNNARAINCLGYALSQSGRFEEAIPMYREALRLRPDYVDAHFNLAEDLVRLRRADEAEKVYRAALALAPNDAEALAGLAAVQVGLGDFSAAEETYRRALAIRPRLVRALSGLGLLRASQGSTEEAAELLQQTLVTTPDNAELRLQLGIILAAAGRFSEATEHFSYAVHLQPDNHAARYRLALALASGGRYRESLAHYPTVIAAEPANAEALASYGVALSMTGDASRAITVLRQALEKDSSLLAAQKELAWLLSTARDERFRSPEEAVRWAERLCRATQDKNVSALDTLAAAYASAGRFDDAVRVAGQALEKARQANLHTVAGLIEARLKQYGERRPYRSQ